MALPIFAVTLFISAFILFLVQPIVGQMILPKLGGTPQVWNTCMVFFQAVLLAGYAYAHFISTRFSVRKQLIIHGFVLLLPFAFFIPPIGPLNLRGDWWTPPLGGNPIPVTMGILALVVGVPFFVVATSAPLLQKWFAYTGDKAAKDPYFLYAASNAGSLLALLAYPLVVEWTLPLRQQAMTFAIGYGVLLVMVVVCAVRLWQTAPHVRLALPEAPAADLSVGEAVSTGVAAGVPAATAEARSSSATAIKKGPPRHQPKPAARDVPLESGFPKVDVMTPWRRFRWVLLGAIPSSMMLGVTTHITTDLSPIPLFWLIPLTLYLLSFILVFSRWPTVWTGTPHQVVLYAQPIGIAALIFSNIMFSGAQDFFSPPVFFNVLGFFLTALACHGELARDRPSTKYLTEFYLLMSLGGVTGGIFNGLLAPMLFTSNWEYPLAIIGACLVRPMLTRSGWTDDLVAGLLENKPAAPPPKREKDKKHHHHPVARMDRDPSFHYVMDAVLAAAVLVLSLIFAFGLFSAVTSMAGAAEVGYFAAFGVPLIIACFYFGRPLRLGGAIAAVLLVYALFNQSRRGGSIVYSDRSYFGIIRVQRASNLMPGPDGKLIPISYTNLLHGNIDHGMNFEKPGDEKDRGNPKKDFSRLPTTYYHRLGPVGRVMNKFNWFLNREAEKETVLNEYTADARMVASQIGLFPAQLGVSNLPLAEMAGIFSEPAYATIGLGTGTMASYGRPFGHVHFYEIDNHIRRLSLPMGGDKQRYFTYLKDAQDRGAQVQVLMGDARLRMAFPYDTYNEDKEKRGEGRGGGPQSFYHMMVVDAFSSDAIPRHLLTREAFQMYFDKLAPEGILCVHTSNRYVNLVKVVADVADSIELDNPRKKDVWLEPIGGGEKIDLKASAKDKKGEKEKGVEIAGGKARVLDAADALDARAYPGIAYYLQALDGEVLLNSIKVTLPVKLTSGDVIQVGDARWRYHEQLKKGRLVCRRGHDNAPGSGEDNRFGHYTSEWVMVARDPSILDDPVLRQPVDYVAKMGPVNEARRKKNYLPLPIDYWNTPIVRGQYVWTDDYSNLFWVLRKFDDANDRD